MDRHLEPRAGVAVRDDGDARDSSALVMTVGTGCSRRESMLSLLRPPRVSACGNPAFS